MIALERLRSLPGVLFRDLPRYGRALRHSGAGHRSEREGWISICNRIERLRAEDTGPGVTCEWTWGSALHAPQVLPLLGRRLLESSLAEWPIRFGSSPAQPTAASPRVSFIIAHSGEDRLPQLLQTLDSLFAQQGVECEWIVIDQSPAPLLGRLPPAVVYRHLDKAGLKSGWHKTWAYNIGARVARGSVLVFHDGDVCAPSEYARELAACFEKQDCAAASLQRFLFYLDAETSKRVYSEARIPDGATPISVFQNWKGGTIAVRRDAFHAMGGFDEGFVDWGGEDDEFYDRCAAIGHRRAGFLPFAHLWHKPQVGRRDVDNPNTAQVLPTRLKIPREQRIAELSARAWGDPRGPMPAIAYRDQVRSE